MSYRYKPKCTICNTEAKHFLKRTVIETWLNAKGQTLSKKEKHDANRPSSQKTIYYICGECDELVDRIGPIDSHTKH